MAAYLTGGLSPTAKDLTVAAASSPRSLDIRGTRPYIPSIRVTAEGAGSMPIYEYECRGCSERHEFIQKFSDSPKRKCPSCGKLRLRKLISAAAFHLKGDGWYVTDFRDKGKGKSKDAGKSDSAEGSSDSKAETKGSETKSSETKSTDSKGAGKSKSTGASGDSSRAA